MKNIKQFIEKKLYKGLMWDDEVKELLSLIAEEFRMEENELRHQDIGDTSEYHRIRNMIAKEQNKKSDQLIKIIK